MSLPSRSGSNQGIGFAVPANLARWVMDGLVENGSVQRGFLGVMIQDVNAGTQVEESSPTYEAGLRPGDVITEINRNAVKDADEAMAACEKSQDVTLVKIWRDGISRYMVVDEAKQG